MKSNAVPDLLDLDDEASFPSGDPYAPQPVPAGTGAVFSFTNVSDAASKSLYADVAQTYYRPGSANPLSGAGVKIGILSNSFDVGGGEAGDVAAGDLPPGVTILLEGPSDADDEGRAMAEGIHRIAPGAQLYFYSADDGESSFAAGIVDLYDQGCRVIVDDVTYLDESFFQPGSDLDQAIDYVVAHGATYLTSAGNSGALFYEAAFAPVATTIGGSAVTAENFGGGALQALTIQGGKTIQISLEWDQPYATFGEGGGATSSLALELLLNGVVVATSVNQRGAIGSSVGQDPAQLLTYTSAGGAASAYQLAVVENGGSVAPTLFKYVAYVTSYSDLTIDDPKAGIGSGSVVGHHQDPNAITVGAANYAADARDRHQPRDRRELLVGWPGRLPVQRGGPTPVVAAGLDRRRPGGQRGGSHQRGGVVGLLRHVLGGGERSRGRGAAAGGGPHGDTGANPQRPDVDRGARERRRGAGRRRIDPGRPRRAGGRRRRCLFPRPARAWPRPAVP